MEENDVHLLYKSLCKGPIPSKIRRIPTHTDEPSALLFQAGSLSAVDVLDRR